MVNTKYSNAYKEVLVVLNNLVQEDYQKIPKEYIKFLEDNCTKNYVFEYDLSKPFNEQVLLEDSKYILFGFFQNFGATDKQKEKIESFKSNYYNKFEEEKRDKYNPNDLFKSRENKTYREQNEENEMYMITYKESFVKKIINKIRRVFKRY